MCGIINVLVMLVSNVNVSNVNLSAIALFSRKALELLGIPCFLGGMSRGMLGKNSPIHIRQNRRDALKEADVVLLAGQSFWPQFKSLVQAVLGPIFPWLFR